VFKNLDIQFAILYNHWEAILDALSSIVLQNQSQPELVMLFGFDTIGRGLEIGFVTVDQCDIVIHAMKIRPSYKKYL
jgi:hypothetical protein